MNLPNKEDLLEIGLELADMFFEKMSQREENKDIERRADEIEQRARLYPGSVSPETLASLKQDAATIRYKKLIDAGVHPEAIALQMEANRGRFPTQTEVGPAARAGMILDCEEERVRDKMNEMLAQHHQELQEITYPNGVTIHHTGNHDLNSSIAHPGVVALIQREQEDQKRQNESLAFLNPVSAPSRTIESGYCFYPEAFGLSPIVQPSKFFNDELKLTEVISGRFDHGMVTSSHDVGSVTPENLSSHLYHNYPSEQPQVMGLYQPAPLFHPNQDPNLPFFYNPVDDSYLAFRWDYSDDGPMIPPLTKDMLARYGGLFLTTHPSRYHSPWVNTSHRLTEVFFKRPKVLITNSEKQFNSWFKHTDPKDTICPGILELHPSLKWYVDQGYNALMHTEIGNLGPEILLLDPVNQVVGVRWTESPNGTNVFPLKKNYVIQENHETRTLKY